MPASKKTAKKKTRKAPGKRSSRSTTNTPTGTDDPGAAVQREWTARPYQQTALDKFHDGKRRQILIWHRRAGKDNFALNLAAAEAEQHVGTYWHLYPTHVQAKRAIFNGIDKTGIRFIDQAFPKANRAATRIADMQIEMKNGSMWQLCGSDKYDSLVGANPRGVVFSEWALCDPDSWNYVRPIIRENNGWVVFITTYRGRNHAYRMAKRLAGNPGWFVDIRTVEDTTHPDGSRILTDDDIDAERAEGMSEALLQQEYYCNPMASVPGAIYGRSMEMLLSSSRLGNFGYDAGAPVYASWSLDSSHYAVIFWQTDGNTSRVIGSKSFPFEPLPNAIQQAQHGFPWKYIARHIVPNNVKREMIDQFERYGMTEVAPQVESKIEVTRDLLNLAWIDNAPRKFTDEQDNNETLVDALQGFRFLPTKAGSSFTANPANTWEKHFATAVEVFAAWRDDQKMGVDGWHEAPSTEAWDRAVI